MAEKKKEDVQNYIDIYETAEFLLADCIASADVSDEVREETYAAIPDDIRNFVKAFQS